MKVFVPYSDAIEHLLRDFYLPSVPKSWTVTTTKLPDSVAKARAEDFQTLLGVWVYNWIANTLEAHPSERMLFTGCDQFFRGDCEQDLESRMGNADVLSPQDGEHICGDFRYVRSTPKTIMAFRMWPLSQDRPFWWAKNVMLDIQLLPHDKYWSMYSFTMGSWRPGLPMPVPPSGALWVHGNGTSLEHKAKLLSEYQNAIVAVPDSQKKWFKQPKNLPAKIAQLEGVPA